MAGRTGIRCGDVASIQFEEAAPYRSGRGPDGNAQPIDDNRDNRDEPGYDQARMERVVLPVGTEVALSDQSSASTQKTP